MAQKSQEQALIETLLVEMRKFTNTVATLEALVPRIEKAINEQIDRCRADMGEVYLRLRSLEEVAACKKGKDSVVEKTWYRNPHWWHTAAVWGAIAISLYLGTRPGGH